MIYYLIRLLSSKILQYIKKLPVKDGLEEEDFYSSFNQVKKLMSFGKDGNEPISFNQIMLCHSNLTNSILLQLQDS